MNQFLIRLADVRREAVTFLVLTLLLVCVRGARAGDVSAMDFSRIDAFALAAPPEATQSVASLAAYLKNGCTNDLEITRAIFRWMADNIAYDTPTFLAGAFGSTNPDTVLRSRKSMCAGYACLFVALGRAAGLEVQRVTGYGKGLTYSEYDKINGFNHDWNAVKLNGEWRLLDVTWGAGHITPEHTFARSFEPFYFLTPPDQFVLNHLPANPHWQLLDPPLSKEAFAQQVFFWPAYFRCGLKLHSPLTGVVQVADRLAVEMDAPRDSLVTASVEQGNTRFDQCPLFCERTTDGFKVEVAFPAPGQYEVCIYAKKKADPGMCESALRYKVTATAAFPGRRPFPVQYGEFVDRGVTLTSPRQGVLQAGGTVDFALSVPDAEEVGVIIAGRLTRLTRRGDRFEGKAAITGSKVSLCARFPGGQDYSVLLEYEAD